jgi:hypothetical protein
LNQPQLVATQYFEVFTLRLGFAQSRAQALEQRVDYVASNAGWIFIRPHGRDDLIARETWPAARCCSASNAS